MKGTTKNYFLAIVALLSIFISGCKKDDAIYYVHSDHIKTPEVVTDKDKKIVWEGHRKPFGETEVTVSTITQPIRFPGQYFDQETGLSYNLMRDYDSNLGRYIEADPIGLKGGTSLYGYAGQNPLMAYDPNGEFFFLLLAPALGLTTGTALTFDVALTLSLLAYANNVNIVLNNQGDDEWGDWEDLEDDHYPDPYGGYDKGDEEDAENLADNLTGNESCELIRSAITALENRIRGRRKNCNDHWGGDKGHNDKIKNLENKKAKLEAALSKCK